MPELRQLYVLTLLVGTLYSGAAHSIDLQCSGCRTLEDAARVGTGYLWDKGNGFAGIFPPVERLNKVKLVNSQLGLTFNLELSVGWFGVSLGPVGSLTFLTTLSREFSVVDGNGAKLRGSYSISELDLNASLWRLASHVGFSSAMAVYNELGGWRLENSPFTDLAVFDEGYGLSLSFERHYNHQPNVITTITECAVASCGLVVQSTAQAPGGAVIVPLPSEEPKNRER
ncbi:MAG: hypothetical protein AAGG11_07765 [Pseudomonadota bacterium]